MNFTMALMKFIGGGILSTAGIKSAGQTASDTVDTVFIDEFAKSGSDGKESSPNKLACRRNDLAKNKLTIMASTPTTGDSEVEEEWKLGTMERYHVPCPHCGEMQPLLFRKNTFEYGHCRDEAGNLDFEKVRKGCYYKCVKCSGKITNEDKLDMIKKGEWVPTAPEDRGEDNRYPIPGTVSVHISQLYLPWDGFGFGDIAVEYLKAKGTGFQNNMKNFINSTLGESFDLSAVYGKVSEDFTHLWGKFRKGELIGKYRVLSVDVQHDVFKVVICGFDKADNKAGTPERQYVIWHGIAREGEDLFTLYQTYKCCAAVIDVNYAGVEGARRNECYRLIAKANANGLPWFGMDALERLEEVIVMKYVDPFEGTQFQGRQKIGILKMDSYKHKEELAYRRKGGDGADKEDTTINNIPLQIYTPTEDELRDIDKDFSYKQFCKEFACESLVDADVKTKIKTGKSKIFKAEHKDNHSWDCMTYAIALFGWMKRDMEIAGLRELKKASLPPSQRVIGGE